MPRTAATGTLRLHKNIEKYIKCYAAKFGVVLGVVYEYTHGNYHVALAPSQDSDPVIETSGETYFNALLSLDVLCGKLLPQVEEK